MIGAAGACLLRGILVSADRAAWLRLGGGALAWSAGDLWYSLVLGDDPSPPTPPVSDGLFLAFYPAAYSGLALLVRPQRPRLRGEPRDRRAARRGRRGRRLSVVATIIQRGKPPRRQRLVLRA
jgi:hypothetical protein